MKKNTFTPAWTTHKVCIRSLYQRCCKSLILLSEISQRQRKYLKTFQNSAGFSSYVKINPNIIDPDKKQSPINYLYVV